MDNAQIARTLLDVSALLQIRGANFFRVRAYENAARQIEIHTESLSKMVEAGEDLTQIEAIGKDMATYITELVETGTLARLEALKAEIPVSLLQLLRLPGVGPKKVRKLWDELGVVDLVGLEAAARDGQIAGLAGFGPRSEKQILESIDKYKVHQAERRFRLSEADEHVLRLLAHLEQAPGEPRVAVAGSYRRRRETVGDLDVLVASEQPGPVMAHFLEFDGIRRVAASGDTKSTVHLAEDLQVDCRVVPPKSFGAALVYFTGSKAHNIKLRKRAIDRGLRLSEYGVFEVAEPDEGEEEPARPDPWAGTWVAGREEADVYATVDLPWIPAELREDRGEIEAAAADELPGLIRLQDMRGDLQMHTEWSDGRNSLPEMVAACAERGYEYIALTDHARPLAESERRRKYWKALDDEAAKHEGLTVLKCLEVDVRRDGTLDLDDEAIEELDLLLIAVHSSLDLPQAEQTERLLKALSHPKVSILAHPTGRKLGRRAPMSLDFDAIFACAKENRVAVEHDAHPNRLDLSDVNLMRAAEMGLSIVISTDAHSVRGLDAMHYGVEQARRAWLRPDQVLNTRPLDEFLSAFSG